MIKCILFATIVLACNRNPEKKDVAVLTTRSPLDTLKTRLAHLRAKPLFFEGAFINGTTDVQGKTN